MRKSILASATAVALSFGALIGVSIVSNEAAAQSSDAYVNIAVLDIKPAETAKFLELTKMNSAASVKEPGCRESNFVKSKTDPNHFVIFEICDSEAAFNAYQASEIFKQYKAATDSMVEKATIRGMSVIALNSKGH